MAKLFIVPKGGNEPVEGDSELEFVSTDDEAGNLETALRALSFLLGWMWEVGPEGIEKCADGVRRFREDHQ